MMAELPTSAQAYRILQQEETHLGLSAAENNDTLACRVEKRKYQDRSARKNDFDSNRTKKQHLYCDMCKINGHNKDKCWKIVGYPTNFKTNSWKRNGDRSNANMNNGEDGLITAKFTTSQYQQLLDLLNKQGNQADNTTQLAGMTCLITLNNYEWIIDSGASNHMCYLRILLITRRLITKVTLLPFLMVEVLM